MPLLSAEKRGEKGKRATFFRLWRIFVRGQEISALFTSRKKKFPTEKEPSILVGKGRKVCSPHVPRRWRNGRGRNLEWDAHTRLTHVRQGWKSESALPFFAFDPDEEVVADGRVSRNLLFEASNATFSVERMIMSTFHNGLL